MTSPAIEKALREARVLISVLDAQWYEGAGHAHTVGDRDALYVARAIEDLRAALEAAQREPDPVQDGRLARENIDLAILVRRLALALRTAQPDHPEISDAALDYLRRIGHVGGVLR